MPLDKINHKTIARIAAVQTLYQYKLGDSVQDIDSIIQRMLCFYHDEQVANAAKVSAKKATKIKLSVSYFKTLVKSVIEHLTQIDEIISAHLTSQRQITNLPILLLALLRVAICELQFSPYVPSKVIINEFTDITSDMLSEHEVGFVNALLDRIAKK